jgi:antitoxin CptB
MREHAEGVGESISLHVQKIASRPWARRTLDQFHFLLGAAAISVEPIESPEALAIRKRRALFRATHRGTKEMDWLLGRFVAAQLDGCTAAELDGIETLNELGDPELNAWILDPSQPMDPDLRPWVDAIRQFHGL